MKTLQILLVLVIMGNTAMAQQDSVPQIRLEEHLKGDWSQKETDNVKVVIDFIQHLMNAHDFAYVRKQFGHHNYVQHNRGIPDTIEGLVDYVEGFAKRYPDYSYDVKRVFVDGDYVLFHSHVTTKAKHRGNEKKGFIIIDAWRVEDGQIRDHYDAVQPINGFLRFFMWMAGGKVRNSNPTF